MKELTGFQEYLVQEEKSTLTVEKYLRDAGQFLCWLRNRELSKAQVLAYKEYLIGRYAIASVNSMLSSLNCYLTFIGRGDCCVKTVKQQRRTFLPEEKELTKQEYTSLLHAAQQ